LSAFISASLSLCGRSSMVEQLPSKQKTRGSIPPARSNYFFVKSSLKVAFAPRLDVELEAVLLRRSAVKLDALLFG
jgi:hypothetical protein